MAIYYFLHVCSTHYFKCGYVEAEVCDTLRARAFVLRGMQTRFPFFGF
jgi:hypothetical protein